MSLQTELTAAVTLVAADGQLLHQIVHGDDQSVVQTEGGPVKTVAKAIADIDIQLQSGLETLDQKVAAETSETAIAANAQAASLSESNAAASASSASDSAVAAQTSRQAAENAAALAEHSRTATTDAEAVATQAETASAGSATAAAIIVAEATGLDLPTLIVSARRGSDYRALGIELF